MSTGTNRVSRFRQSLGNRRVLSNTEVDTLRKSYYINSVRNSEDAPAWMLSTSNHYRRSGIHRDEQSIFQVVKQTDVYEREREQKRGGNSQGQFHFIKKKSPRPIWGLKDQTFHFEWPKKQEEIIHDSSFTPKERTNSIGNSVFTRNSARYVPSKYALTLRSPLHRQQPTVIKIGHSNMIDSTYIK